MKTKKLLTLLTLLVVCVTGAWADPTFKGEFTDLTSDGNGKYYTYLNSTNYASYISAGWMSYTGVSTGSATLKINPATDEEDTSGSSATYGKVKNDGSRYMEFYVTGISSIKFYFANTGSSDRKIQYKLNNGSATDLVTVVQKTSDSGSISLDPSTNNTIRIFSPDNDVYACALKVTPGSSGPVNPSFSLTKTSIGVNETSQIQVGTKGNLDGITISSIQSSDDNVATVTSAGVVTGVAAGTATITFSTYAVTNKYNATTNQTVTITVVDKSATRTWDFSAITTTDLEALKGNTAFTDNSNEYITNSETWAKDMDYALEASDGTDISVADGLLFGRAGGTISAGSFRYYYGNNKYVYFNNSNSYVKIPDVYKGQQVIITVSAGAGRTFTATNATCADDPSKSSYSYSSSDGTVSYVFNATANGIVQISGSGNYYIHSIVVKLGAPTITTQPIGASYVTGDPIAALTVEAVASAGDLSYQWYKCDDANKTNASAIDGATSASYTPSETGFYYVKVTDSNGSVDSDVVEVSISSAVAPTIIVSGAPAAAVAKGTAVTLTATVTGNPEPTVQWYSNATASTTGGTAIEGATNTTYSPATTTIGTFYYYAVASNGVDPDATSELQTIVVMEQVATPTIGALGYFMESQNVTITCETAGATIKYSLDGTNYSDYTEPFEISDSKTIKAKAILEGYIDSDVAELKVYKVAVPDNQEDVTAATTWDFTSNNALKPSSSITNDPIPTTQLLSTVDGYASKAGATQITFLTPQRYDAAGYAQAHGFIINTTVPGALSVKVGGTNSNTRYMMVNGERKGTINSSSSKDVKNIYIPAGTTIVYGFDVSQNAMNNLRYYKIEFNTGVTATIAESGFTTLSSACALDFSVLDDNLTAAYIVTELTAEKAKFTQVTTAVPAETGLVLQGTPGATVTIPVVTSASALTETNYLKPCVNGGTVEASSVYAMSGGVFKLYTGTELPVGKAYLQASDVPGSAPELSFEIGGETTGISNVNVNHNDNQWYDLSGRKVENPTKGVYIMNGKKVIVK